MIKVLNGLETPKKVNEVPAGRRGCGEALF